MIFRRMDGLACDTDPRDGRIILTACLPRDRITHYIHISQQPGVLRGTYMHLPRQHRHRQKTVVQLTSLRRRQKGSRLAQVARCREDTGCDWIECRPACRRRMMCSWQRIARGFALALLLLFETFSRGVSCCCVTRPLARS
jgi:hypothetical protein